jgi:hypothetical protein
MHISITGLKPKGLMGFFRFWRLAIPSFSQAKTAKGNLFCEVRRINGFQCTLTAWEDKSVMREFMKSAFHIQAMKFFRELLTCQLNQWAVRKKINHHTVLRNF